MGKIKTIVTLAGQEFKINCDDSEEYIQDLAKYVNKSIADIQKEYPGLSTGNCVLLASLNMADELYKLREDYEALDSRISQLRDMPRNNTASIGSTPVKRPFENTRQPSLKK